jgi:hypothetical protein
LPLPLTKIERVQEEPFAICLSLSVFFYCNIFHLHDGGGVSDQMHHSTRFSLLKENKEMILRQGSVGPFLLRDLQAAGDQGSVPCSALFLDCRSACAISFSNGMGEITPEALSCPEGVGKTMLLLR